MTNPKPTHTRSGHPLDGRIFLMSLCHLSIAAVFLIGPFTMLFPLIVWIVEVRRGNGGTEPAFQAKQAFLFQLIVFAAGAILGFLIGILTVLLIGVLLIPVSMIVGLAAVAWGIWGGVRILQGERFRYAWLGEFLET